MIKLNKVKEEIEKSKLYVPVKKSTIFEKSEHNSENHDGSEKESDNRTQHSHKDDNVHSEIPQHRQNTPHHEAEVYEFYKHRDHLEVEGNLARDKSHSDLSKNEGTRSQSSLIGRKTRKRSRIVSSDAPEFECLTLYEQLEILESESDYIVYNVFYDGDSFGELALINNSPRSATVVWVTDWIFATMDKNDYWKTLSRIESRNINKVIDFFKSLPYFSNFSRTALTKIRFNFRKVKYKCNYVVYREGDESDHAYIVINGDFELEK